MNPNSEKIKPIVDSAATYAEGFPYLDWKEIHEHLQREFDGAEWDEAMCEILRTWTEMIAATAGADYCVAESKNFLVMSNLEHRQADRLQAFCERSLTAIMRSLDGVASRRRYVKHVLLVFASHDAYYPYISYFYPERAGDFALTAGVFLHRGYGHLAMPMARTSELESVIVHELTHACVAHLPLPKWLNEGVAVMMENALTGSHRLIVDRELLGRLGRHWNADTIQEFWSGASFSRPGDGNELSYRLAQFSVRALSHDYELFREFVTTAKRADGGEQAAWDVYGGGLGGLMEQFLGDGDWDPQPDRWHRD